MKKAIAVLFFCLVFAQPSVLDQHSRNSNLLRPIESREPCLAQLTVFDTNGVLSQK